MDFFESQSDSRRESMLLMVAFSVVFIVCFAIVYWFASLIAEPVAQLSTSINATFVRWGIIGAFTSVIVWGCYKRWQDVSDGGQQLAIRLGAFPVSRTSDNRAHKQFCNLVDEMAVAASVTAPECYVISRENSINAFVAGNSETTVVVVTQGTLDQLDADELRAVVAHEMAHIASDDLGISMQLLIAMGGLNAISVAGRACFSSRKLTSESGSSRDYSYTHRRKTSRLFSDQNHDHGSGMFTIVLIGITVVSFVAGALLCLLGSVFTFLGHVLKAAFSRKRELLADAKAVQFTRNTWGLASALNKIADSDTSRGLHSRYAGDVAHMCIDAPLGNSLFPNWMATHPPLQSRITSVEPHFRVKHRKKSGSAETKKIKPPKGAARTLVKPDLVGYESTRSLNDVAPELSILFSLMIQSAGYNTDTNVKKYESTLKCYTNEPLPMRLADEPGVDKELENALEALVQLPTIQRQNLLDHIAELVDHDGIQVKEETELLAHVYERLNPSDKAA